MGVSKCLETIGSIWLWVAFSVFVLGMLALDLGVFHRKAHEVRVKEALTWSIVWIALALVFNAGIYWKFGSEPALQFLTGYLIEKALSVDNLFVFLVVFSYFSVPKAYQHRVLFWGILGALVFRAIFIALGAVLLAKFHWVMYLFGAILVVTGIRLMLKTEEEHPERNPLFRLFTRFVPSTSSYRGTKFLVKEAGRWFATPLLLVLIAVESTDIVFAVDSIPAIFAITSDPFIVFTSNIFAILGLRALYFLLADVISRFAYLKYGLAAVLVFVGIKMLIVEVYKIPILLSLGVVVLLLAGAAVFSIFKTRNSTDSALDQKIA
jgi:tellurite resistance protein TerC